MSTPSASRTVTVVNPRGFHARPAGEFVRMAREFESTVSLAKSNERIDGKSILDILTLAAVEGTELEVSAIGSDADEAVSRLAEFIASGFGGDSEDSDEAAGNAMI